MAAALFRCQSLRHSLSDGHGQRENSALGAPDATSDTQFDHECDNETSFSASQSSSQLLPTELLQEIYSYLGPFDFNAARHTCSNWITASLDLDLLIEQLKRGG